LCERRLHVHIQHRVLQTAAQQELDREVVHHFGLRLVKQILRVVPHASEKANTKK
jgi:hypothetical protein